MKWWNFGLCVVLGAGALLYFGVVTGVVFYEGLDEIGRWCPVPDECPFVHMQDSPTACRHLAVILRQRGCVLWYLGLVVVAPCVALCALVETISETDSFCKSDEKKVKNGR